MDHIKDYLTYNESTGEFVWKISVKGTRGIGKQAGTLTNKGYMDVCIRGKKYGLHRVAFYFKIGKMPSNVDHINGIKSDNRWCNLRPASIRENAFNTNKRSPKSGFKNVYYDKRGVKKWFVVVFDSQGKKQHLGYFLTPEEANTIAVKARKEFHGDFYKEIT